jgi:hypothetical protein
MARSDAREYGAPEEHDGPRGNPKLTARHNPTLRIRPSPRAAGKKTLGARRSVGTRHETLGASQSKGYPRPARQGLARIQAHGDRRVLGRPVSIRSAEASVRTARTARRQASAHCRLTLRHQEPQLREATQPASVGTPRCCLTVGHSVASGAPAAPPRQRPDLGRVPQQRWAHALACQLQCLVRRRLFELVSFRWVDGHPEL